MKKNRNITENTKENRKYIKKVISKIQKNKRIRASTLLILLY
ncbi:MAG: hypothetical protein Q4G09_02680 [Clostridia bacterium]|nr:hypothetical protein [Clostridia bacterium]